MIIQQLSIFLENRVGGINDAISVLSNHNINMRAFCVADGVDFGILRVIVSDVDAAVKVLQEANFRVAKTDVICLDVPNTAGALSRVLKCLAQEDVFIEYMYAFSEGDVASTVIRPTDIKCCAEILEKNRELLLSSSPLYQF